MEGSPQSPVRMDLAPVYEVYYILHIQIVSLPTFYPEMTDPLPPVVFSFEALAF